ncbi:MAG: hypothetical protein HYX78_12275 [Armatimonadetes bacterium]|nr:hypothetical protein [Armatimonadota bacterium]
MVIALGENASHLERIAAEQLAALRWGETQVVTSPEIGNGVDHLVLLGTPASNSLVAESLRSLPEKTNTSLDEEEFHIRTMQFRGRPSVLIAGGGPKGALYGAGRLIREMNTASKGPDSLSLDIHDKPAQTIRGIFWAAYAKGYDDYTVWCYNGEFDKLRSYLIELMLSGMNAICLTFWLDDPGWYLKKDPESRQRQSIAAEVINICRELDLKIIYWWPVNTVPKELWEEHPELRAKEIFGLGDYPAFCPSHPEGRKKILETREAMFAALPPIDILHVYPKDVGGCGCEKCRPYHIPYSEAGLATLEVARRFHPDTELMLNLWYLTADEQEEEVVPLFLGMPDVTYVGAPVNFNLSANHTDLGFISYTALPSLACREQLICEKRVVLWNDITMRGGWGRYGLYPMPRQIKHYYDSFPGAYGSLGYTEGVGDHLNKLMLLALAWNPDLGIEDTLNVALTDYLGCRTNKPMIAAMLALEVGELDSSAPLLLEAEKNLPTSVRESWRWQILHMFHRNAASRFEVHRLLRKIAETAQELVKSDEAACRTTAKEMASYLNGQQERWRNMCIQLSEDCHRLYPEVHQVTGSDHPFFYGGPSLLNPSDTRADLDAVFLLGIDVLNASLEKFESIRESKSPEEVRQRSRELLALVDGYRYYDDCQSLKDGTIGLESITAEYGWVEREEKDHQAVFLLKATALAEEITVDFAVPLRQNLPMGIEVAYTTKDFTGDQTLQCGESTTDDSGRLTIPGLRMRRGGTRLTLAWQNNQSQKEC